MTLQPKYWALNLGLLKISQINPPHSRLKWNPCYSCIEPSPLFKCFKLKQILVKYYKTIFYIWGHPLKTVFSWNIPFQENLIVPQKIPRLKLWSANLKQVCWCRHQCVFTHKGQGHVTIWQNEAWFIYWFWGALEANIEVFASRRHW